MLSWWRRRKERQQQIIRDADNLMTLFGDRAYSEALARARREGADAGTGLPCGGRCASGCCSEPRGLPA